MLRNTSFYKVWSKFSTKKQKRIVTVYENNKFYLKVQPYTFLERLVLHSIQGFTYWPISSHFHDLFGKYRMNSSDMETFIPPNLSGMKMLDKDSFKKVVKIPGIKVPNKSIINITKSKLKSTVLHIPKLKTVVELEDNDQDYKTHKLVLLDPRKCNSAEDFSEQEKIILQEAGIDLSTFKKYDTQLSYENWSVTQIVRALVPELKNNVTGFSQIGHIAHLNLKEDALQSKYLIGQIILDKISSVKTVVNKTGEIDSTFRNFKMELLAGEERYITQTKEHGLTFEFDFSKVYWNPRLSTEHQRVVKEVERGDIVYDVFAGVGPFAIPAAKNKKAIVYANDLNPSSYESLLQNVKLNKVKTEMHCSNLDGRKFIKTVVKTDLQQRWKHYKENGTKTKFRVVMNLPALAIEFTDAFKSLFVDLDSDLRPSSEDLLPYMYVYCFSKSENPEEDVRDRIEETIGSRLPEGYSIHNVRNVAPNKEMMCVSFHMPASVLFGENISDVVSDAKKRKLDC